ncbi:TPA: hypothetical protein ACH3X1_015229 [Trebouxia sp. C0004]
MRAYEHTVKPITILLLDAMEAISFTFHPSPWWPFVPPADTSKTRSAMTGPRH